MSTPTMLWVPGCECNCGPSCELTYTPPWNDDTSPDADEGIIASGDSLTISVPMPALLPADTFYGWRVAVEIEESDSVGTTITCGDVVIEQIETGPAVLSHSHGPFGDRESPYPLSVTHHLTRYWQKIVIGSSTDAYRLTEGDAHGILFPLTYFAVKSEHLDEPSMPTDVEVTITAGDSDIKVVSVTFQFMGGDCPLIEMNGCTGLTLCSPSGAPRVASVLETSVSGLAAAYSGALSLTVLDEKEVSVPYTIDTTISSSVSGLDGLNGYHPGKVVLSRLTRTDFSEYMNVDRTGDDPELLEFIADVLAGKRCLQNPNWTRVFGSTPFTLQYDSESTVTHHLGTGPGPDYVAGTYTASTTVYGNATVAISAGGGFGNPVPNGTPLIGLVAVSGSCVWSGPSGSGFGGSLDLSIPAQLADCINNARAHGLYPGSGVSSFLSVMMDPVRLYVNTILMRQSTDINTVVGLANQGGFVNPSTFIQAKSNYALFACGSRTPEINHLMEGCLSYEMVYENPDPDEDDGNIEFDVTATRLNLAVADSFSNV